MSRRAAAISIPGMILSQLGMRTRPSNGWAITIDSTESAISSRELSEYFIPSCPMTMPSQTPIVKNSMGVPPAIRIPALTASEIRCRWRCPGMISLAELAMPIIGRSISRSVNPSALNSERCGALSSPFFIVSDRIFLLLFFSGRRRGGSLVRNPFLRHPAPRADSYRYRTARRAYR